MNRDLIGYGGEWPNFTWPNGARLAVSVVINFEEGAELQVIDGDNKNEKIGEVLSVVHDKTPDQGQAQIFAYGPRVGVWRIAHELRKYKIPTTIFTCGRAAKRASNVLTMLANNGHEIACHGWLWKPNARYKNKKEELRDLDKATSAIFKVTKKLPLGFFCRGSESPWTRELLVKRGYFYSSNAFDDDLPYTDPTGLTIVPYALDTNDMKFFHPNGFVRAKDMVDYVVDALDVLENETHLGETRLLNIGFHLRIIGRPGRFKAFEQILQILQRKKEKIWIARRIDIAKAFVAATCQK